MHQSDSENKNSRRRINIDLGNYHDDWLSISEHFGVKPTTFAAALLKNTIDEVKQQNENISFKLENLAEQIKDDQKANILLRLNQEETAALELFAAHIGRSKTQAVISILRSYLANQPSYTLDEEDALENSNEELRMIGVNLNQVAHRVNMMDLDSFAKQDVEDIKELIKRLTKKTETISKEIKEHTKKVFDLLNAGRHRASFIKSEDK